MLNRLSMLVVCLIVPTATAPGQTPGLTGYTGGTAFSSYDGNGDTVGWYFTLASPITLSHLGFWDQDQNGLAGDHQVAIWEAASQTQLVTTSVQAGTASPLTGQWRYEPIAPLRLTSGVQYVIGAYYHANSTGMTDYYIGSVAQVSLAPGLTLDGNARDPFPGTKLGPFPFTFPSIIGPPNGRFGPNFLFSVSCYPDCNEDGALTVADFGCFQTKFVAGDPYADCNEDGVLTVADFGCFQTKFVAGCP
jgi:hypothetical protein